MEPTLSQALHLLNGDTVNAKIQQGGLIPKLIKEKKTAEERVAELYVRCLARKPSKEELDKITPAMGEAYKRLGDTKLSDDAKRVLQQNHPDHPWLSGNWPRRKGILTKMNPFATGQ